MITLVGGHHSLSLRSISFHWSCKTSNAHGIISVKLSQSISLNHALS